MDAANIVLRFYLLILTITVGAWAREKEVCCDYVGCFTNAEPFDSLPLPECEDDIQVGMMLYTRLNREVGELLTRSTIPPSYMAGKPVVFVVHGYLQNIDVDWLRDSKDALLTKFDYNVVTVGWGKGAFKFRYIQAASNTRVAGAELQLVIRNLMENGDAKGSDLWCVGYSLGAHICGHAGKRYKFGKITGLDPSGPWFEDKNSSIGLNPSCADFVEVWHTNGDTGLFLPMGTLKRLGHVDFYPNGGGFQPGCIFDSYKENTATLTSVNRPYISIMPLCSHVRVMDLFLESINSECQMYARMFCVDESNIPASCFQCEGDSGICGVMGMDSHLYDKRGLLYLTTNSRKPFCMG